MIREYDYFFFARSDKLAFAMKKKSRESGKPVGVRKIGCSDPKIERLYSSECFAQVSMSVLQAKISLNKWYFHQDQLGGYSPSGSGERLDTRATPRSVPPFPLDIVVSCVPGQLAVPKTCLVLSCPIPPQEVWLLSALAGASLALTVCTPFPWAS